MLMCLVIPKQRISSTVTISLLSSRITPENNYKSFTLFHSPQHISVCLLGAILPVHLCNYFLSQLPLCSRHTPPAPSNRILHTVTIIFTERKKNQIKNYRTSPSVTDSTRATHQCAGETHHQLLPFNKQLQSKKIKI